ncbi:MAG: hypothetical protein ACXADH_06820, partial [Candidatus Kariarchaeaceae archaeon]
VDAIYNFDLGRDFAAVGNVSKFIELRNTRLADYVLNRNNRVLNIDDISPEFVSNESNDLSDYRIVATYPAGRYFQRFLTQSVYRDENPLKDHYQINEFISVTLGSDTYFLQKFESYNNNQVGLSTGYVVFDTEFNQATSKTELFARPNEPFDTDYEIKSLQFNFSDSLGIGTTSLGHTKLISTVTRVAAASSLGVTTSVSVLDMDAATTDAAFIQMVGIGSDQIDFYEYAVMHNGTDTYLTELATFNTRQNLSGLSNPRFIGTVTSGISSGVLSLNFENGSQADVDIKCKVTAYQNNDVGVTTNLYRYKIPFTPDGTERSGRLEVNHSSEVGIQTMVGITSFTDLSAKSTVWVSAGSTQSVHQVYLLTDPAKQENFIGEFAVAAIGTTTGIGTFGADYKTDGSIAFEFYPNSEYSTGIVSITAYNELLYKILDPNGTIEGIGDLTYGSVIENVSQNLYLGINNRDKKTFELKYKGTPIYARETNIANPSELDRGLGQFNFKHFFSPGEQLSYNPDSNLVGIAGSALVYYTGVGTAYLPETVYAIKNNNNQFQVALNQSDALQGIAVTFVNGSGQGNKHRFTMRKRDSKSIIAISGLVQKPISYTSITYALDVPVAGFATAFVLSGISSIQSGDLIKIEDEYSIVRTVGFGTTSLGPIVGIGTWTLVEVERGAVGTAKTAHSAGETARLFRGSFQILDSNIHFTQAPLGGDIGLVNDENLPFARATFSGRTFLRKDYTTNQLFDDISESFDGLETTYPLTSIGVAVTGIGSTGGNGVLFINNIFQAPFSENNTNSNFKITEASGISSVQFTGISSFGFTDPIIDTGDINENQLPRGGIIVSLASTPGRGYAPFVGAKVRAEVDAFGAIQNIIGIPTTGSALGIVTASYNNTTGILSVRTSPAHGLTINDQIKLVGLEFTCPGVPADAEYNNGALISENNGTVFDRALTVNGLKLVVAGAVGGQLAVPDEWAKKTARTFELMTDPNGVGINSTHQRNFLKTLKGDAGTKHAGIPTVQRVGYGGGSTYTPNWLLDVNIASYAGLQAFNDSVAQKDMVWYRNISGPNPPTQRGDIEEIFEHIFHTIHAFGIPGAVPGSADAVEMNPDIRIGNEPSFDWENTALHLAMKEAIDAGLYDPSGYATDWNTDPAAAATAYTEYTYLINWSMWDMSVYWNGGSLSPEWDDSLKTPAGMLANNPLGYALFNTYFAPVLSKPNFATIESIFGDNDTGVSGYVVDPLVSGS